MPSPDLRKNYLQDLTSALGDYVDAGKGLRVHSERLDSLQITLTLDSPDDFHEVLSRRLAARGDQAAHDPDEAVTMHGAVGQLRVRSGQAEALRELLGSYRTQGIPGHVVTTLYRLTDGSDPSDEMFVASVFTDRETYLADAESARAERGRIMRALLDADLEWREAEVFYKG